MLGADHRSTMRTVSLAAALAFALTALLVALLGGVGVDSDRGGDLRAAAPSPAPAVADDEPLATPDLDADLPGRTAVAAETGRSAPASNDADLARLARLDIVVQSGGRPVDGAAVRLDEAVSPCFVGVLDPDGVARTDERGRASFHVLPTRLVQVAVTPPEVTVTTETAFTSPFEGDARTVVVELFAGATAGLVDVLVDSLPSGQPLQGARIEIDASVHGETDADGRASLPLLPGARLEVSAAGHSLAEVVLPSDHDFDQPFRVALNRHARLFGHVPPPAASGVPMRVLLDRRRVFTDEEAALVRGLERASPFANQTVKRDEVGSDGRWSIEGIEVPHGELAAGGFTVWVKEGAQQRCLAADLELRPGDERFVPDPWAATSPFEVRFVYASGRPAGLGPRLFLFEDDGSGGARMVTSAHVVGGRGSFPRLPEGTWAYALERLMPDGGISGLQTVEHDGTGVAEIVLEGVDTVAGRVVGDLAARVLAHARARGMDRLSFRWTAAVVLEASGERPHVPSHYLAKGQSEFRIERVPSHAPVEVQVGAYITRIERDPFGVRETEPEFVSFATAVVEPGDLEVVIDVEGG